MNVKVYKMVFAFYDQHFSRFHILNGNCYVSGTYQTLELEVKYNCVFHYLSPYWLVSTVGGLCFHCEEKMHKASPKIGGDKGSDVGHDMGRRSCNPPPRQIRLLLRSLKLGRGLNPALQDYCTSGGS